MRLTTPRRLSGGLLTLVLAVGAGCGGKKHRGSRPPRGSLAQDHSASKSPEAASAPTPTAARSVEPEKRIEELFEMFRVGVFAVDVEFTASEAVDVLTDTCGEKSALARPVCVEGGSYMFTRHLGRDGDPQRAIAFATEMKRRLPLYLEISCVGMGIGYLGRPKEPLFADLVAGLSGTCRERFMDGLGYQLVFDSLTVEQRKCRGKSNQGCLSSLEHFSQRIRDADPCPSTTERGSCAFGMGRALGNIWTVAPGRALEFCASSNRLVCLAGVGFVVAFNYPDALERSLGLSEQLGGAEQCWYESGVALALAWLSRFGESSFASHVAELELASRQRVEQLLTRGRICAEQAQPSAPACGCRDMTRDQ